MASPDLITALTSAPVLALLTLIVQGVFALLMVWIKRDISEQKKTIEKLEVNTNSMKDQLVKVVGEAENAKGNLQGRADQQSESDAKIVAAGQKPQR
jgi:uncharacterized membrane protein YhiD involved in acid resistance